MIKLANKIALAFLSEAEEGMEKKALSVESLLRMSRNAAKKGKLSRFSELLNKRNSAIDKVSPLRETLIDMQRTLADIEESSMKSKWGPEWKEYMRMSKRSIPERSDIVHGVNRFINDKNDHYTRLAAKNEMAGPWILYDLLRYASK